MLGVWKHFHRLDLLGDVPSVRQELEVPRQGLRVAGDVDHLRRRHFADGRQELFGGTGPRRVHHDDVDLFAGRRHLGDEAGRVARVEFDVFDLVPPRVGLRVPDGGLVEFDADDPLRALAAAMMPMVPVPQYASKNVSLPVSPAKSIAVL